ncbi:MAG: NAD-dependent epimerase/dehydratase family protein [Oligoflexia bacterium]|nr:NAD-dependent epimerase/dehydratase family protein [Oligoflexia bacterium]
MSEKKTNILIIGIAGGLAKILAGLLVKNKNYEITGVDPRSIKEDIKHENITYKQMRFTRGNFERLFRDKEFDVVFHLARMSHSNTNPKASLAQRLDLNLMGTKRIMDLSLKFGVKKLVILSTYHVYGALSDNPVFIDEDSPLKASIKYPELRDVVEMDQISTNWLWKNKDNINTVVLRPCSIIGPQIKNTMTQYLTSPYVPICMDFNPMFQFIHEFDMAKILERSIDELPTGIYNVAPDETVSIKKAKQILNTPTVPVPSLFLESTAWLLSNSLWQFPKYLIDYIKYSSIIDNTLLKAHLGHEDLFQYSTAETLELSSL